MASLSCDVIAQLLNLQNRKKPKVRRNPWRHAAVVPRSWGQGKGRVPGVLLPFLLSRILQPMAFLAVWEQHRYCPSIQKQG